MPAHSGEEDQADAKKTNTRKKDPDICRLKTVKVAPNPRRTALKQKIPGLINQSGDVPFYPHTVVALKAQRRGSKRTMLSWQVFWLFGSSYRLRLPIPADSGMDAAFVLESQRRARSRFQRDSLLSLHGHHSFPPMGRPRDCQEERFMKAAGISA